MALAQPDRRFSPAASFSMANGTGSDSSVAWDLGERIWSRLGPSMRLRLSVLSGKAVLRQVRWWSPRFQRTWSELLYSATISRATNIMHIVRCLIEAKCDNLSIAIQLRILSAGLIDCDASDDVPSFSTRHANSAGFTNCILAKVSLTPYLRSCYSIT